jgi:putative membrane protein
MPERLPDNPAKRNFLALLRTRLANERTLLSYIRTALYFLVGGIALLKVEDLERISILGYVSFIISSVLVIIGLWRFWKLYKKLNKHKKEMNNS